LRITRRSVII